MSMSNVDEELVVAEKGATTKAPGLLVGIAIAGIVLALFKLSSYAMSLPWLIYPQMIQAKSDPNGPPVMIEYQRLMVDLQAKYYVFQLILLPLGILVAGLLIWAALRAYKLRPHGDFWLKSVVIVAAVVDLYGAVIVILMQVDNYHILQTVFQDFEPDGSAEQIMQYAMNVGFYVGAASGIGFLVLQLGYYFVTFRYFSKPEVHALYQDFSPAFLPPSSE